MKIKELASSLYELVLDTEEFPTSYHPVETINLIETEVKLFLTNKIEARIKEYDNQIVFYSQKMFGSPAEKEYEIRKNELESLLKDLL